MDTNPVISSDVSRSREISSTRPPPEEHEAAPRTEAPPETAQVSQAEQKKSELVQHLLKENEYMNVEFDDKTKRVVFQSVDRTSGEIVNQYPSKEMLTLAAHFRETIGVFSDQEV
ncbi:MAG: flagellar protein FlaG [Parvibaculaceae bacterium]|nr:flagellar protein FlaG [Parvibaculaceae bacterium]